MDNSNPLLDFSGLPRFKDIQPQHIEPALDDMLDHNLRQIDGLIDHKVQPNWENFMQPMEEISDQLSRMWSPVSHLNSVKDSDELRLVYEACLPKLTNYATELGQNESLFKKMEQIRNSEEFERLTQPQKKTIENELRDFRLSGVNLEEQQKRRNQQINAELSELCNQFSQNVLDATDAWCLHVSDQKELQGLPELAIRQASIKAENQDKEGWVFTLHGPSYVPFMTYCNNRSLRKEMYHAYVTRASDQGPQAGKWDNAALICRILKLRRERSELLGFKDYVDYSLQTKMAQTADEVSEFLLTLADRSRSVAEQEFSELVQFAADQCAINDPEPWDYAWLSEQLKIRQFDVSDQALRPYFPLPKVQQGMFAIVQKLFAVKIREKQVEHVWHPSIQFFEVSDYNGQVRGYFYTDLYAREHKNGGAWMGECISRRMTDQGLQLPVAYLNCNFPEPMENQPSLLSHDEVITLFHEFGHTLHHLLTKVDVAAVSGINGVPWDAVELPSQFLENWCWERQGLDLISEHYVSGESIPDELLDKLRSARNFQSAMQMLRQIEFSLFDLEVHKKEAKIDTAEDIRALLGKVRAQISVVKTTKFNRFENSFGHIFSGGYAAGYYSYKWAEVLSADAYSRFEECGIFDEKAGKSFMINILEQGGSVDPMALFVQFRGRKPNIDALLRHSGLG